MLHCWISSTETPLLSLPLPKSVRLSVRPDCLSNGKLGQAEYYTCTSKFWLTTFNKLIYTISSMWLNIVVLHWNFAGKNTIKNRKSVSHEIIRMTVLLWGVCSKYAEIIVVWQCKHVFLCVRVCVCQRNLTGYKWLRLVFFFDVESDSLILTTWGKHERNTWLDPLRRDSDHLVCTFGSYRCMLLWCLEISWPDSRSHGVRTGHACMCLQNRIKPDLKPLTPVVGSLRRTFAFRLQPR